MSMERAWHKRNQHPLTILDLPKELRAMILIKNANDDICDHGKVKTVCNTLREDAESEETLVQVDFLKTHKPHGIPRGLALLKHRCLELRNPTCVFLKEISNFMYTAERQAGFQSIKLCAGAGSKPAMYCCEVIRMSISPEMDTDPNIAPLSRGTVRYVRRTVDKCVTDRWPPSISEFLIQKQDALDMGRLSTCRCAVYRRWHNWWDEDIKGLGMCNTCFWLIETAVFLRIIPRAFDKWPRAGGWGQFNIGWNGEGDWQVPDVGDEGDEWEGAAGNNNDGVWGNAAVGNHNGVWYNGVGENNIGGWNNNGNAA